MNLPNFKDILKIVLEKLSVLKSNVSVMISIIIALAALVLFIPTQLLSSGLKKEIDSKSVKILKELPNLEVVSEEQLKSAQALLEDVEKETNSIEELAIQTTKRELLNNDIFNLDPNDPNTSVSQSVFYEFSRQYCGKISQFIKEHNANLSPTTEEIQNELQAADSVLQAGSSRTGGMLYSGNQSVEENIKGMIADQICQKQADTTFVYIDPFDISGYDFWSQYQYGKWIEDVENCWYSQLGYWIIEDIFDVIVAANTGNESLVTAPVKRLMKIYFIDEFSSETSVKTTTSGDSLREYADRPQYVLSTDEIPKETLTGRYCDEYYDVVHFKIKLIVETNELPGFLKQLCGVRKHEYIDKSGQSHNYEHNQITILDMILRSVDMKNQDHELYRYGDVNVSEVEITCEYLFNKKGYEDVKPQSVKDFLSGMDNNY